MVLGASDKNDVPLPIKGWIGLAIASYNKEIVDELEKGFEERINEISGDKAKIYKVRVPGSLELGQGLRFLTALEEPSYSVLVALGCVIRGETYHFEIVSKQSAASLERVSEKTGIPVINGILTCENHEQAKKRIGKGHEFADAAARMASLIKQI